MLRIFWAKWLALTVFENIAFAIRLAKIETRQYKNNGVPIECQNDTTNNQVKSDDVTRLNCV